MGKRRNGHRSVGEYSRAKGRAGEIEAAKVLGGERTSQTGLPGPDIIDRDGRPYEVKRRAKEFKLLYEALAQTQGVERLMIRDDRKGWLVVLPVDVYKQDLGLDVDNS